MQPTKTEGYITAKRFLRDHPSWVDVLEACLVETNRTNGEFAGAWVLEQAKKSGRTWFPNLRPLVSYGILKRTDVTRGGRRAYYIMCDVAGVTAALKEAHLEPFGLLNRQDNSPNDLSTYSGTFRNQGSEVKP
jgi:hypothetical protein